MGEPDPILSFVETGALEQRPRLLVERLLYTRALLQSNVVLAPRFQLGDCAAAHHILLGSAATAEAAAERMLAFGFRVEAATTPPSLRFLLSSSHSEGEIRALLLAITMVIRELSSHDDPGLVAAPRTRTVSIDPTLGPRSLRADELTPQSPAASCAAARPGTRPPR